MWFKFLEILLGIFGLGECNLFIDIFGLKNWVLFKCEIVVNCEIEMGF